MNIKNFGTQASWLKGFFKSVLSLRPFVLPSVLELHEVVHERARFWGKKLFQLREKWAQKSPK